IGRPDAKSCRRRVRKSALDPSRRPLHRTPCSRTAATGGFACDGTRDPLPWTGVPVLDAPAGVECPKLGSVLKLRRPGFACADPPGNDDRALKRLKRRE